MALAVLCACQDSTTHDVGDGEEESNAALVLYNDGDHTGALRKWRAAAAKGHASAKSVLKLLQDK